MIFVISDNIRFLAEENYRAFARNVSVALERHHFFSFDYNAFIWFEKEFLNTDKYYGEIEREELRSILPKEPPTSLMSFLTRINVGDDPDHDIGRMTTLIDKFSFVIVENNLYDGSTIKKWIKLYRNERNYKTLNQYVHRQVSCNLIDFSNGGGKDNIANDAEYHLHSYNGFHNYKLFSIFDSDKSNANDIDHNVYVKQQLNDRSIDWHELEKRELENYFPLASFQKCRLTDSNGSKLRTLSDVEWDFCDLYTLEGLHFEKKDLLILSDNLTKEELKSRLEHCVNDPDELQKIIFKIAKIA